MIDSQKIVQNETESLAGSGRYPKPGRGAVVGQFDNRQALACRNLATN
jgi:hypothetical protein